MNAPTQGINGALLQFMLQATAREDAPAAGDAAASRPQRSPEDIAFLRAALEAAAGESPAARMAALASVLERGVKADQAADGGTEATPAASSSSSSAAATTAGDSPEAGAGPTVEDLVAALDEMLFLVEDLDNANDLAKIDADGRAVRTVVALLEHSDARVRAAAAWTTATVAQNNPAGQADLVKADVLAVLLRRLVQGSISSPPEDGDARHKVVGAVSAMTSGGQEGERTAVAWFVAHGVLSALRRALLATHEPRTRIRILLLLARWARDHPALVGPAATQAADAADTAAAGAAGAAGAPVAPSSAVEGDLLPPLLAAAAEPDHEELRVRAVEALNALLAAVPRGSEAGDAARARLAGLDAEATLRQVVAQATERRAAATDQDERDDIQQHIAAVAGLLAKLKIQA